MESDPLRHYADKLAYEIDSWDLKVALEQGEKMIVIDARSAETLSHRDMDRSTTASLDTGALIVTYCDGIGCDASTKGALNMAQQGFRVRNSSAASAGGSATAIRRRAPWRRRRHPAAAAGEEGGRR